MIAYLVLAASVLTGCANQNVAANQTLSKPDTAARSRSFWAPVAKATANRKISRSLEERGLHQASPEHTGSLGTHSPNSAQATIQPVATTEINLPSDTPDPRTMQAMNCRELMLKEHPKASFSATGNAAAQRNYFDSCMRRTGDGRQARE